MILVLYLVAILFVVIGVILILYTNWTTHFFKNVFFIKRVRLLSVIPLFFGVVLIACSFCNSKIIWLSLILGFIAIFKGLYLILGPVNQITFFIDWFLNRSGEVVMRLFGIIMLVLGLTLISNVSYLMK